VLGAIGVPCSVSTLQIGSTPHRKPSTVSWSACSAMNLTSSVVAGRVRPRRNPPQPSKSRSPAATHAPPCEARAPPRTPPPRQPLSDSQPPPRHEPNAGSSADATPQLRRDRRHRFPLRAMIRSRLRDHPHRPLTQLQRIPPRRIRRLNSILPKEQRLRTGTISLTVFPAVFISRFPRPASGLGR
jgi:hypothetical protein